MLKNKNYTILFAPAAVLLAVSVMYAFYGIFPFGEKTVSWCDMNQQTVPLLMDLKDILDGKSSILYSAKNAGGMNFWGVFLFFLASPLYLTVKFVSKNNIIYLVNILLAVKLALSAMTAAIYLRYVHKKLSPMFITLLSVMYGLCGYGLMYMQTLVWLDVLALFPVLMLGIHRMCLNGKPLLYCLTLSLTVAINYYLSFMIIIFILISVPLFIRIRCRGAQKKRAAVCFITSSFTAALITAPVWMCAFLQVNSSARSEGTLTRFINRSIFDNIQNKVGLLMFTALFLAALLMYIKHPLIKKPQVKYNFILLILLTIPVIFDPVNKIWHTGSYQCFPLRYGFANIFVMMSLAAYFFESMEEKEDTKKPAAVTVMLAVLAAGAVAVLVYIIKTREDELSDFVRALSIKEPQFKIMLGIFVCVFIVYAVGLSLYRQGLIGKRIAFAIFAVVFAGEFYSSFSINIGFAANDGELFKSSSVLAIDSEEPEYHRTKTEKKYLHVNQPGGLGYNSLGHYTSLTPKDYMFTMKKLGYSSYWMEVGSNGGTILTDALLGIKYSIGTLSDFKSYHDIEEYPGDLKKGRSDIYCPIGIKSVLSPDECASLPNGRRVDTQKLLARNYFGTDDLIYEYDYDNAFNGTFDSLNDKYAITPYIFAEGPCQLRYTIDIKGKQVLYFDLFDRMSNDLSEKYNNGVNIYVDGDLIMTNYPGKINNGITCLGEFCDTTVQVMVTIKKKVTVRSFGLFGIDVDKLKQYTDRLSRENGCEMYLSGNKITASCSADEGEYLYMSIPYEEGLTAEINGEPADIEKFNDCFCAIKLRPGENKIELSFMPKGMRIGIALMLCGLILLVLLKKIGVKKLCGVKFISKASSAAVPAMCALTLLIVYAVPLVIKTAAMIMNI